MAHPVPNFHFFSPSKVAVLCVRSFGGFVLLFVCTMVACLLVHAKTEVDQSPTFTSACTLLLHFDYLKN